MCIGMANGGKEPEFMSVNFTMGDLGRIYIPQKMFEKLKIKMGDKINITATGNIIVIEKCEGKEE